MKSNTYLVYLLIGNYIYELIQLRDNDFKWSIKKELNYFIVGGKELADNTYN